MSFRMFVVAVFCFFIPANSVYSQDSRLNCPKKTKYVRVATSPQVASEPYYPQVEEFCQKKKNGVFIKEGPYRLWGPNGEKFEEGQFVGGKKEGKWLRWIPSQILEDTWSDGKIVGSEVLGTPSSYVIDFKACYKHSYAIPTAFGSTVYKIIGKEGKFCKLIYSIEIEMGQGPEISCSVPLEKGKLTFFNTPYGINFADINQYCTK